jgi:hypothetical protein
MTLLELQRRMAEDVCRPPTADFGMRDTTNDGASVGAIAATYISPNDRLSSFERLEIYNRQYWFRLISAVSEDFPALNALLGPKRFDPLILAYLNENQSTSWTLRDLGAKLPNFLEAHPEFTGRRHRCRCREARVGICRRFRSEASDATYDGRGAGDRSRVEAVFATASPTAGIELSGRQPCARRQEACPRD